MVKYLLFLVFIWMGCSVPTSTESIQEEFGFSSFNDQLNEVSSSSSVSVIEIEGHVSVDSIYIPNVIISSLLMMPKVAYKDGLIFIEVSNKSSVAKIIVAESSIQGVSETAFSTEMIAPGEKKRISMTPLLTKEKFNDLKQIRDVNVMVSIRVDSEIIYGHTFLSSITAHDVMAWSYNDNGKLINYEKMLLGWVTPSTQGIENVISLAKNNLASKSFSGYQNNNPYYIMSELKSNAVCCGSDAFGGAPDPYYVFNGPNHFSYSTSVNRDNRSRTQSWNIGNLIFKDPGTYNYVLYDEDVSNDDLMSMGSFEVPSVFFTERISVLQPKGSPFTFYAQWYYPSNNQVSAIYSELKRRNMSYVSSSQINFGMTQGGGMMSGEYSGQKIRFPDASLASSNYNCIDGVVLFASILESVGLDPLIILVPGHAYLGWYEDTEKTTINVLETTMLATASFIAANNYALEKFKVDKDLSTTSIINVRKERSAGFLPIN
jgi:hypothetical protein